MGCHDYPHEEGRVEWCGHDTVCMGCGHCPDHCIACSPSGSEAEPMGRGTKPYGSKNPSYPEAESDKEWLDRTIDFAIKAEAYRPSEPEAGVDR